jgi:hypothetical protein
VPEEAGGILSGDTVESGSKRLLQRLDGARGDPPQIGLHLGPSGFDRAQVRTVGGQIAIGKPAYQPSDPLRPVDLKAQFWRRPSIPHV